MNTTTTQPSGGASTMNPATISVAPTDPGVTHEPQQITQWIDDTATQEASLPNPVVPNKDVLASGLESRDHTVIDVLERPVRVAEVEWSDANLPNTDITSLNFPEALISASPNIADKISHFTFLRAHIEVRFVVNANTFQAGRLVAFFAPFSRLQDIGDRLTVNNYLSAKTVFPRVVLDAGSGNSGKLLIPYVSYFTHYDLARALGDLGTIYITVLNPLQTGNCTVSVFARFTNISIQIPTAVPNALGSFSTLVNSLKSFVTSNRDCDPEDLKCQLATMLGQNLGRVKRSTLTGLPRAQVGEPEARAASGVVSAPMQIIGNMASAGSSLPVVGQYLAPIGWMANAISCAAQYFGFSKSANLQPTNKIVDIPGYGFTNADGVDNSLVMGASMENSIGSRNDVFGSDLDEMDINFICAHESFLKSFTWSTSSATSSELFKYAVSPGSLSYTAGPPVVYDSTALGYVASMFRYWRGGIKIKIQITKTAYHSGRLRVSFVPSGTTSTTGYDFNQGYSEIIDLRTSDQVELVIPFVSNTIWKPVDLVKFDDPLDYATTTGMVFVTVINKLRAPDSVTPTLNCNMWVSGADDMQFAIPDFVRNVPVASATNPTFEFQDRLEDDVFEQNPGRYGYTTLPQAQVMGAFQDAGFSDMSSGNEMFDVPKTSKIDASATCIGEHITNLRHVIRRFGRNGESQTIASDAIARLTANSFGTILPPAQTLVGFSPVDYVSYLYRFFRGSTRHKVVIEPNNTGFAFAGIFGVLSNPGVVRVPAPLATDGAAATGLTALLGAGGSFSHFIDTLYNRVLEFTLPYYSNTHVSLLRGPGCVVNSFDDRTTEAFVVGHGEVLNTSQDCNFYKAAGDDFSFGWLVGPPRLLTRIPGEFVVNFATATVTTLTTNGIAFRTEGVTVTPTLPPGTKWNVLYPIITANAVFPITDLEGELGQMEGVAATAYSFFFFDTAATEVIDGPSTTNSVRNLGTVTVRMVQFG